MPRPQFPMHDILFRKSLKHVVSAVACSLTVGAAYYFLHHLPLRAKYKNFYSTYDPMASFNRMREGGYLQSCSPTGKAVKKAEQTV